MANVYPCIDQLPKNALEITNTETCVKYLATIANKAKTEEEVKSVLQHIAAIIEFEISVKSKVGISVNQVILNTAYRAYFSLLQQNTFHDKPPVLPNPNIIYKEECGFRMIYAILLCGQKDNITDSENLLIVCTKALNNAVNEDCSSLLHILKALNLLLEKFPKLQPNITLHQIYHCLQSNRYGMREESIDLFTKCCSLPTVAFEYFLLILEFWPWTNRYKFYLLKCILKANNLRTFLNKAQHLSNEFFAGLRLSLSHKSLLAASQYLVKALSAQSSDELLHLSADILMRGTIKEIKNFNAYWFGRIEQKEKLFEYLQIEPEISLLIENESVRNNGLFEQEYFRSTIIFSLFSRQIFEVSELHFYKICAKLNANCFHLDIETQMLVFKFIADNFSSFSIENCLKFVVSFIKEHKSIDNAHNRNEILGKIPAIINYISKAFCKLYDDALRKSILWFFKKIHLVIETDINSEIYQPKIFALRLLEMLLKSLYADNLEKNAKNCCIAQNRNLGQFLIEQNIFDAEKTSSALFELLEDPWGFDDALDLILELLRQIKFTDAVKSSSKCKEFSQRSDVDECALSTLYARATTNSCKYTGQYDKLFALFEFAKNILNNEINGFQTDPLLVCKTRNHLFGYINIMGEIVKSDICLTTESQKEILDILIKVLNIVLEFLNVCKADSSDLMQAASFQDMDESLGILVSESGYTDKDKNKRESRKFLLMSFWLTLKAACDLATTIGWKYITTNVQESTEIDILSQCLNINISVLTRCRHKGAIEAAGVSIGKLTKSITANLLPNTPGYNLLEICLDLLFDNTKQVSITRRGAGYSIMMLHIVKNEQHRIRPLLKRVMEKSIRLLNDNQRNPKATNSEHFDRFEALLLHYLGVLVRDTELRIAIAPYYNDILLVTLKRIEGPDWTEFNAALQLFGALIPKIVGQSVAKDFDLAAAGNENNDITYDEIIRKLPTACEYIIDYFALKRNANISTRTTVLFLGFLSNAKHLVKQVESHVCPFLENIRKLMWRLLAHHCERVRNLAAICFVRAHDFRFELPQALINIAKILNKLGDVNFFMGLISTLSEGVLRLQHETLHTNDTDNEKFLQNLRSQLANLELFTHKCTPYSLGKLLNTLSIVGLNRNDKIVQILLEMSFKNDSIGYVAWQQSVAKFVV